MPNCENCGGHVTEQFALVFGDNQNRVDGCLDCLNKTGFDAKETGTGGGTA